ncbi:MAG: hypothetical protein IJU53_06425, partial [Thermoguttaceae bacterium]|nr:hypothetical protein [Thermoguttaceae bacterium]
LHEFGIQHHSFFPFLHLLQAECVFCIGKMGVKKLIVKIYPVHKLALPHRGGWPEGPGGVKKRKIVPETFLPQARCARQPPQ